MSKHKPISVLRDLGPLERSQARMDLVGAGLYLLWIPHQAADSSLTRAVWILWKFLGVLRNRL